MYKKNNEASLCEEVLKHFERSIGAARREVTYPEKDGSGPPVEIRFLLDQQRFAIEHTVIEPFPKAIDIGLRFSKFAGAIEAELSGNMPKPGFYELRFPLDPTEGILPKNHKSIRFEISKWVREAANEMHAEEPKRHDRHRKPFGQKQERKKFVGGIELTLARRLHWSESGKNDGSLFIARMIDDDLEPLRKERLETALDTKLPKLEECSNLGDITVLILEFDDGQLSNNVVVAEALGDVLSRYEYHPQHIFLAETVLDLTWYLYPIVVDGLLSHDRDCIEVATPSSTRRTSPV